MTCEKCWSDAYVRMMMRGGAQADHYQDLLRERADEPCDPYSSGTWIPCPGCQDFWCRRHEMHAHDCPCPAVDAYEEGGV